MAKLTPEDMANDVSRLLHARFSVGKTDLATALRRSKRRLPRDIRTQAAVIVDAAALSVVPKLARQVNLPEVTRAYRACVAYLKKVGQKERRTDFILGVAGSVTLALILIFATAVMVLR